MATTDNESEMSLMSELELFNPNNVPREVAHMQDLVWVAETFFSQVVRVKTHAVAKAHSTLRQGYYKHQLRQFGRVSDEVYQRLTEKYIQEMQEIVEQTDDEFLVELARLSLNHQRLSAQTDLMGWFEDKLG